MQDGHLQPWGYRPAAEGRGDAGSPCTGQESLPAKLSSQLSGLFLAAHNVLGQPRAQREAQ